MQPKVSVIVPVYNNEVFVVTCVKSLLAQTLQNIEVICINDGSTDSSSDILHAFADHDDRVVVVDKENAGYGVGINTGLDLARGEYVTILESDDFADLDMLETLVNYSEAFDLEVCRANFYLYWAGKIKNDHVLELFPEHECDRVIDPRPRENQHCFYVQPALWSALYKASFIKENRLRLLETPGAAYQDTAFNFKIWACARRVMFVNKPFVHYRQDNENSSINNPSKVETICGEYAEIRRWLREDRPDLLDSLAPVATKMMCDAYTWNLKRVAEEYRLDFAIKFGQELKEAEDAGCIDPSLFEPGQLSMLKKTISSPNVFVDYHTRGIDSFRGLEKVGRKISTFCQVAQQDGGKAAISLLKDKVKGKNVTASLVDLRDNEFIQRKKPVFLEEAVKPKISVVMPVYNCQDVLEETLNSVFAQSMQDFELICVNDGSTDDSLSVLRNFQELDSRIRIIDKPNGGPSSARNRGLREARAPYTLILDSDDIFDHEMFAKLLDRAEKTGADLIVCSCCEYKGAEYSSIPAPWALKLDLLPSDLFTPSEASDCLFEAIMGWPWDRLYKTSFIREQGIDFPEDMDNSEDGVFVYSLLAKASLIAIVPDVLIKHRVDRGSSVSNTREKSPECFYQAICRIKSNLKKDPELYSSLEKSFLNWALDYATWNIESIENQSIRAALSKKFMAGSYPELEYGSRSVSYFNLYGDVIPKRIIKMKIRSLRS